MLLLLFLVLPLSVSPASCLPVQCCPFSYSFSSLYLFVLHPSLSLVRYTLLVLLCCLSGLSGTLCFSLSFRLCYPGSTLTRFLPLVLLSCHCRTAFFRRPFCRPSRDVFSFLFPPGKKRREKKGCTTQPSYVLCMLSLSHLFVFFSPAVLCSLVSSAYLFPSFLDRGFTTHDFLLYYYITPLRVSTAMFSLRCTASFFPPCPEGRRREKRVITRFF